MSKSIEVVVNEKSGETVVLPRSELDAGAALGLDAVTVAKAWRASRAMAYKAKLTADDTDIQSALYARDVANAMRRLDVARTTADERARAKVADKLAMARATFQLSPSQLSQLAQARQAMTPVKVEAPKAEDSAGIAPTVDESVTVQ